MVGIFLYSTPLQKSAQHPPGCVFICKAAFQLALVHGVTPAQVQDFAFSIVEFHEIPVSPFLSLAQSLWMAVKPPGAPVPPLSFASSAKLPRGHCVTLSRWGMKSTPGPISDPGGTTSHWPPAGLPAVHHHSPRPDQTVLWITLLFWKAAHFLQGRWQVSFTFLYSNLTSGESRQCH